MHTQHVHHLFKMYFIVFLSLFIICSAQQSEYECPYGWVEHQDHCYRFARFPMLHMSGAQASCQTDGSRLISVNDPSEHSFVLSQLSLTDPGPERQNWWTSGKRQPAAPWKFFWEGDGTEISSYQFWMNDSIPKDWKDPLNHITYHHDTQKWGWILEESKQSNVHPYICEIDKKEIYKIVQEERGPDYGSNNPNMETVPRGPTFLQQPVFTVHDENEANPYTFLECVADAYPPPSYKWYKERAGNRELIDPSKDSRYTIVNGRLIIDQPSKHKGDDGKYQCEAINVFGTILSDVVVLAFGFLQDFPKSPRSDVNAAAYGSATIECNPPDHFPTILYAWYKNNRFNFIRPEVKPYTFISHDSRLYFSEVTVDDAGLYYCMVYKPNQYSPVSPVSMPTRLVIDEGTPAIYEPVMASGFPFVSPSAPKAGDQLRIECLGQGTMPLIYSWVRLLKNDPNDENEEGVSIPFPTQATFMDWNRVITIPNVQINDQGVYKCICKRRNGQSIEGSVTVSIQSAPYFVLPLKNQYVDLNSSLEWVCQASGKPDISYHWYVNGTAFTQNDVPAEDKDRIQVTQNSIKIKTLMLKDSGMYQCEAENIHGTVYSSAELRVLAFKPSFKKYPMQPNQFATREGNTTLVCRPEAAPYPTKKWYKNGMLIEPPTDENARMRLLPNGNIFISQVRDDDQAVYKCRAENDYGSDETFGNLTVLEKSTITMPPDPEITVNVNRTTFLHCGASHNPVLDITYVWFHNNFLIETQKIRYGTLEIEEDPHYRNGHGIYAGGLYIMNVREEHAGRYTCMVTSTVDSMGVYTDVKVVGVPYAPTGVRTGSKTSVSVVIFWKAPMYDNGIPINNFLVEGLNEDEGYWKIHITNLRTTEDANKDHNVNVTGLHPNSNYQFRVRAENRIGTSLSSVPSKPITTMSRKPDMYPEQVGGGGGKVGDLVITWKPLERWQHNAPGIGYRVRWRQTGMSDTDWSSYDVQGNAGRHVVLVGKINYYKKYDVNVQAKNDVGFGPRSPNVEILSAEDLPKAVPTNVMAQPYNATAILVHWNKVPDTIEMIRGKLRGYRIMYWIRDTETPDMAIRATVEGNVDRGLIIGLNADTMYAVNVLVWNNAGDGNIDNGQVFYQRTLRSAPKNMPTEVEVHYVNPTSVHIFFRGVSTDQSEESLDGYYVRLWREGEHIKMAKDYDCGKETDIIIRNLIKDELYKLRVLGYSRGGTGAMSSPTLRFILPSSGVITQSSVISIAVLAVLSLIQNLS